MKTGALHFFLPLHLIKTLFMGSTCRSIPRSTGKQKYTGLTACLSAEGVHYVDLFSTLAKEDTILYRRLDSHWTQQGAGLAGDTLLGRLGAVCCTLLWR